MNAVDRGMLSEIREALGGLLHDGRVRVGTLVSAREALAMGLVDTVVPPEQLRDEAQSDAAALAGKPADAQIATITSTSGNGRGIWRRQ